MRQLAWQVGSDGDMILPGGAGRMKFRYYPSGISLAMSAIQMDEDTQINFAADPTGCQVSAQYFIVGDSEIHLGNGEIRRWLSDTAMVIRSDTPGFHLKIGAGQVLRHVCISMYRDNIQSRIKSVLPPSLEALIQREGPVDVGISLRVTEQLKYLANELYNSETDSGLDSIRSETNAIRFLIEVLDLYGQDNVEELPQAPTVSGLRKEILAAIKGRIDQTPSIDLAEAISEDGNRISTGLLRQLFQTEYGISLATYQRSARLNAARNLLENDGVHVKEAAFACGYSHIGNFTRAYRNHFGEAPSSTRKRVVGH